MIARKFSLLLLLSLLLLPQLQSQSNWRKNVKEADDLYRTGQFEKAARLYGAAYEKKPGKKDLAYKAGEAYAMAKDYANATLFLEQSLGRAKNFPLAGLKYAQALKQSGKFSEASLAFSNFIGVYKGEDIEKVAQIVENEIRGCELGLQFQSNTAATGVKVTHLGPNINSTSTDFAPIPYNEDILYFSSTQDGRAQIYRSQNTQGVWSTASLSTNFPEIEKDHFCNGTLTPDNKHFYFTICTTVEKKGAYKSRCEIFVSKRQGNTWSLPERLRDYINLADATTTHPFVIYNGNTEILYFSSDRPGGSGGMDIWYITRDVNSRDFDFTFPVNCGITVNTPMDEITPYYDLEEATLYFSSNGHVSIGGFDIQKASGSRSQWKDLENAGVPFNSSTDDYYFTRSPSKRMGFFVSNRPYAVEKPATTDEDIFQFFYELGDLAQDYPLVSGFVYDKLTGEVLQNVVVEVFEVVEGGEKFLVGKERFDNGNYSFSLLNNRKYEITAKKTGFEAGTITLGTSGPRPSEKGYSTPIFMNSLSKPAPPTPRPKETVKPPENPAVLGTSYRIQVSAVKEFDAARYGVLKDIGAVQTEEVPGKDLFRVLVGDFDNLEDAKKGQTKAVGKGFKGAIIVLYESGKRIRTID
ncbi:MAG: PD40 domain-containing protein [Saprospirales bacterium]|nr:PD40 domain-containing protein [Saprospirales bacterium]